VGPEDPPDVHVYVVTETAGSVSPVGFETVVEVG
jgi:hypothetical protein